MRRGQRSVVTVSTVSTYYSNANNKMNGVLEETAQQALPTFALTGELLLHFGVGRGLN
jgi:hypothetical protein